MSSDATDGFSGIRTGMMLDGKYEILERIGAGGMGEVFKARHTHLNVFRCIKVMKQALLADHSFRSRFLREARLATQIHHPNIAVVHDFFVGDGGNYMVSEFIDGTTVRQWSAEHSPVPVPIAADIASQVLSGLDHIHRRGLLHRDISPDNIMLHHDADGHLIAKIIDLGIAKDINTVSGETTQAGVLIGNPRYMSPEQLGLLGEDEVLDGRTDLYSLGVVLYEMLTGVPPFVSETPHGYIMKRLTETPARFAAANPRVAVPGAIESVVLRCLERDRNRRFRDARELTAALAPFLAAPVGTLTDAAYPTLSGEPPPALLTTVPAISSEEPTVAVSATEVKAHAFELSLLNDVDAAERAADGEALRRFAEAHPPGTNVGSAARDALRRLAEAREREREEEEAFHRAWEDGRASVWRQFIDEHPESPRAADARRLLDEAAAFERAIASETETGMREFLSVWPEGRHHLEAEIRLVALRQRAADAAFAKAKAAGTHAAVTEFLARFPNAAQADDARQLAAERLAFERAADSDTADGWNAYLEEWPDAGNADEARVRRERARVREEEADFEAARNSGRDALQQFIRSYPEGSLAGKARRLIRKIADSEDFADAQRVDTPAAWRLYLTMHPSGAHAGEARSRLAHLEELAFETFRSSADAGAAEHFLAEFPDSPRRDEVARVSEEREAAEKAKAAEEARQAESRDFDAAWESGTVEAWDRFLREHPEAFRIAEARQCRQEAADFEVAVATNSRAIWRAFVKTWPEGRHRIDAAVRLRESR